MILLHHPLNPHEVQKIAGCPINVIKYQDLDELEHISLGVFRTHMPTSVLIFHSNPHNSIRILIHEGHYSVTPERDIYQTQCLRGAVGHLTNNS